MDLGDPGDDIERYIEDNFPEGVHIPINVSEQAAIRSVLDQFQESGFACPEETARSLVREGWRKRRASIGHPPAEQRAQAQPVSHCPTPRRGRAAN